LKLLLDTPARALPIIGISVKNLPKDTPTKLMSKKHQTFISDITIFEISAKGTKYAPQD
jgi:PIN domain nuclease of toxin-antitoxin system